MLAAGAGDAAHTGGWAPRYRPSGVRTLAALSKTKVPDLGDVRVTVMGGGSFGLAMAAVIGGKGFPVKVLMRNQEQADYLNANHMSDTYIKGVELPTTIIATTNVEDALADCTYAIHAVPVQYSRKYLRGIRSVLPESTPIICTSKGIETGTLSLMQDILKEEMGEAREYAFLSGPSFAREIATGLATAVVVASESDRFSNQVAELFGCETFRVFTSRDVVGVEIGGAVKNVIAIAAGMAEGLGLGTNAMAGLVTRGCLEMQTLARSLGASPNTLMGLSGVGDTFGTCFGPLSRNRNLGIRLGQGEALEDILKSSTEVAEGYATAFSLIEFLQTKLPRSFRMDLKFPILFGVAQVLRGERSPRDGMQELMLMPIRTEMFDWGGPGGKTMFPKVSCVYLCICMWHINVDGWFYADVRAYRLVQVCVRIHEHANRCRAKLGQSVAVAMTRWSHASSANDYHVILLERWRFQRVMPSMVAHCEADTSCIRATKGQRPPQLYYK